MANARVTQRPSRLRGMPFKGSAVPSRCRLTMPTSPRVGGTLALSCADAVPAYCVKVRTWVVPLVLAAVVAVAMLTVVPLGDTSYQCQRSPISLLRERAVETGGDEFFDEGAACNADARQRAAIASAVAVAGALVAITAALAPRLGMRPGRRHPSPPARLDLP